MWNKSVTAIVMRDELKQMVIDLGADIVRFAQQLPGISDLKNHDTRVLMALSYMEIWMVSCSAATASTLHCHLFIAAELSLSGWQ